MEGQIIPEFQNLQVFSSSNILRMDDLVQDLATALEETTRCTRSKSQTQSRENFAMPSSSRRLYKKRKGKKRRNFKWETGNISEASESSIDEALKDYMENMMHFSDSDDISVSQQIQRLTMPLSSNYVPSVESDSVTETFSPIRPQRRRKKHKSMIVDLETNASPPSDIRNYREVQTRQSSLLSSNNILCLESNSAKIGGSPREDFYPGKRKRSSKSRSDPNNGDGGKSDKDNNMETGTACSPESTSSSLSSSSSDSDGLTTNDEGKEADDEQSDFFHEPGPACGIPGIIPWWENQQEGNAEYMESEKQFQQILHGSFDHLPKSSQLAFRARVTRLMAKSGRQMRFGRRRLKQKVPGYTVSKFLQDQQSWTTMQGKLSPAWQSSNGSGVTNDTKRRKKTPPPTSSQCNEGFIGEDAEPIPESNIGNKMLQSMGWNPGSGLGSEGAGIKSPVMAYLRPRRQGLGCSTQNQDGT